MILRLQNCERGSSAIIGHLSDAFLDDICMETSFKRIAFPDQQSILKANHHLE
jgi:hypothetical protein